MVHDIDTIITYVNNNYSGSVLKYSKFYKFDDAFPVRNWMYPIAASLREMDGSHTLMTFDGNSDATNDTNYELIVTCKTKQSGGSYDDNARTVFNEIIKQIRALAKIDTIGAETYLQLTNDSIERKKHRCTITANIWLTKRGSDHA